MPLSPRTKWWINDEMARRFPLPSVKPEYQFGELVDEWAHLAGEAVTQLVDGGNPRPTLDQVMAELRPKD
jgi:hypothetical protein